MRFYNMSTRSTSCWCQARGPKSKVLAGRAGEERGARVPLGQKDIIGAINCI